jgi:hypothetical protein
MDTAAQIVVELERLVAHAKPVPLTDQVRLDRERLQALLAELRQALESGRIS